MKDLWLLLLPLVASFGWVAGNQSKRSARIRKKPQKLPKDYLQGLNYLLNEEPDKAVDLFIKMLEVDSDTVETHLALGNLFRRRGEVDRAIRVHQNLIARPKLQTEYRMQALLALAQDYLSAGVLDRAERLFLELVDLGKYVRTSLKSLQSIYEQEKDWNKAMTTAQQLVSKTKDDLHIPLSNYCCELASQALEKNAIDHGMQYTKRALFYDKNSARASLLLSKIYLKLNRPQIALRHLKQIKEQDSDYFSEAIEPISKIYLSLGKRETLIKYLTKVLAEFPKMPSALKLAGTLKLQNDTSMLNLMTDHLRKNPSIAGLHYLIELQLGLKDEQAKEDLEILRGLAQKLQAEYPDYQCKNCGFMGKDLHWQCPSCRQWNTMKPSYVLENEADRSA